MLYKGEWQRDDAGKPTISEEDLESWLSQVWTFSGENRRRKLKHVAPFPRELPKRCIQLFSFKGDTVLDPFSGSGTTMIEAISNGRTAVGIELSDRNCKLSIERMLAECQLRMM